MGFSSSEINELGDSADNSLMQAIEETDVDAKNLRDTIVKTEILATTEALHRPATGTLSRLLSERGSNLDLNLTSLEPDTTQAVNTVNEYLAFSGGNSTDPNSPRRSNNSDVNRLIEVSDERDAINPLTGNMRDGKLERIAEQYNSFLTSITEQTETLNTYANKLEAISTKLATPPNLTDPNLQNLYGEKFSSLAQSLIDGRLTLAQFRNNAESLSRLALTLQTQLGTFRTLPLTASGEPSLPIDLALIGITPPNKLDQLRTQHITALLVEAVLFPPSAADILSEAAVNAIFEKQLNLWRTSLANLATLTSHRTKLDEVRKTLTDSYGEETTVPQVASALAEIDLLKTKITTDGNANIEILNTHNLAATISKNPEEIIFPTVIEADFDRYINANITATTPPQTIDSLKNPITFVEMPDANFSDLGPEVNPRASSTIHTARSANIRNENGEVVETARRNQNYVAVTGNPIFAQPDGDGGPIYKFIPIAKEDKPTDKIGYICNRLINAGAYQRTRSRNNNNG